MVVFLLVYPDKITHSSALKAEYKHTHTQPPSGGRVAVLELIKAVWPKKHWGWPGYRPIFGCFRLVCR